MAPVGTDAQDAGDPLVSMGTMDSGASASLPWTTHAVALHTASVFANKIYHLLLPST